MKQASMGLIGLAVMGANLARNLARNKIHTLVYNRTASKTEAFLQQFGNEYLTGSTDLADFCARLTKPRRILLMVKAGEPVDQMIAQLLPHLSPEDIVIDGGNSFYQDTRRRTKELEARGIHFVGMGISGGEIGPDGAGHYVKMVHNGIEYADMQLIADVYSIMKNVLRMDHQEMKALWEEWGRGRLSSYLVDITAKIMDRRDEKTDRPLLECVLDEAGQKGTGKWTGMSALDLGVPVPTIAEAVFARCLSSCRPMRLKASRILGTEAVPEPFSLDRKKQVLEDLENALYASKICAYAQGFALMAAAAEEYHWTLHFPDIAKIWRNGCIIRAAFLNTLSDIYSRNPGLENLILDDHFSRLLKEARPGWGRTVSLAQAAGTAVPGLASALEYFDMCRTEYTSANLIQAQRDFFGAHTYRRRDEAGVFHTEWEKA